MTFYEALKANETRRVKFNNESSAWAVGELIGALNRGSLDGIVCAQNKWQVVEEPREFWHCVGTFLVDDSRDVALERAKNLGGRSIALYREVPGTREEVKP